MVTQIYNGGEGREEKHPPYTWHHQRACLSMRIGPKRRCRDHIYCAGFLVYSAVYVCRNFRPYDEAMENERMRFDVTESLKTLEDLTPQVYNRRGWKFA
ncbi:uncharacterized protein G2W53_002397 [Senna tora]|uniref:Uncharacterized protein n=1 Tax=Senna tora TaxID=362788 RepID=A0A835CNF6_9FABA|nr:uncharacterized protein G2W53_002397 [Senna tora]